MASVVFVHRSTGSWELALTGPLILLYLVGAAVWWNMVDLDKPQTFQV